MDVEFTPLAGWIGCMSRAQQLWSPTTMSIMMRWWRFRSLLRRHADRLHVEVFTGTELLHVVTAARVMVMFVLLRQTCSNKWTRSSPGQRHWGCQELAVPGYERPFKFELEFPEVCPGSYVVCHAAFSWIQLNLGRYVTYCGSTLYPLVN